MKTAKDLKIPFSWEKRRPVLLDRFFYVPVLYEYKAEVVPFFEDDKPVAIEYCSGNGAWICEKAKQNPHVNWLAVEKKFERARKIWLRLHRENIPNLSVACGEAFAFTKFYAPKASEAFVNFPDPWPKLRHAKHRLIWQPFIDEVGKIVSKRMVCVTDDETYAQQIAEEFGKSAVWQKSIYQEEHGASFFRALWESKGKNIFYLAYDRL